MLLNTSRNERKFSFLEKFDTKKNKLIKTFLTVTYVT